jgi:propionyl-CoA synthetase
MALHYDSPVTGTKRSITYAELLADVRRLAGALVGAGVAKGDRVVIYLPMVPEAVVAMLACARIGAVHSVVFGGFAPAELAARIDDARPKVILAASCGVEPSRIVEYTPIIALALQRTSHKPEVCVVLQREQGPAELTAGDVDWADFVSSPAAVAGADCVEVAATDPLYILYTSGTTGKPKGVVRDNGGHAVALRWSMENVYGVHPGETWFTASDVGWVVGHSYIVYAPLLTGCTTVLYEGKPVGTPDAGAFFRVISEYGAVAMFTAPTAYRAIKKEDAAGAKAAAYDLSCLRTLFLAGERLDPDTWQWASDRLGIPVVDNWWQTETGWPIAANLRGLETLPIKPGSPSVPVPGYAVTVLDEKGAPVDPGVEGAICLRLPMPPGTLPTLWGDDDRYVASYLSAFDGYYLTGDGGYLDEDGYLYVMGRTDDVLNVAGHRLSTGSIEAALAGHPDVAECAVIGVADELKGQVPRGLVVLKAGVDAESDGERIRAELVQRVRDEVGAVAALRRVDIVGALPKTRSGKILRRTMREIADGRSPATPPTIEDVSVLERLTPVLRGS